MSKGAYLFEEAAKLGLNKFQLGGKGFGLVEMSRLGVPVPPGIVITTEMCREYYKNNRELPSGLWEHVVTLINELEEKTGKKFGDPSNPLLVSVRSGAPYSMPGMMDTILNLGINDKVAEGIAKLTGDERFAYDTYRRFIQMFGKIVMKLHGEEFEKIIEEIKNKYNVKYDTEVPTEGWKETVEKFKEYIYKNAGIALPQDPYKQLKLAIKAVFDSWWNPRAMEYRRHYKISDELCTAVNIVTMVFGNMGEGSGTGVFFTRNPSTGVKELYGEWLENAQGEDIVAGVRTPSPINELKIKMPKVYEQLEEVAEKLERHFRDMQDIEFTIERGKLYILQTRNGKRTPQAAVKIAVDMAEEGLITPEEAVLRVDPNQIIYLLHRQIDPSVKEKIKPVAKGLPASPGAAVGKVVFSVDECVESARRGENVILVRPETTPEDIAGILAASGVLTSRGGMTSHAAVVTRGLGKPCVVGAESLEIDLENQIFKASERTIKRGDIITIDGGDGTVYMGNIPTVEPQLTREAEKLLSWADKIREMGIRTNADTPEAAKRAREMGAEGIGLTRTERMFNAPDRLAFVQSMILADSKEERQRYLNKIKEFQKSDLKEIFRVMQGYPVTIRLLDIPLHEFLPKLEELLPEIERLRITDPTNPMLKEKEKILKRVMELKEHNPMMGQRGVRLALVHSEIYEMQVAAILEACAELMEEGYEVKVEIMMPQVSEAEEFRRAREIIDKAAYEVKKRYDSLPDYKVGTMIETPRGALTAGKIARYADFLSFGTNDLTQATWAFSRDDAEAKFLGHYLRNRIIERDPFETLDKDGVGKLIEWAVNEARKIKPYINIGVCGEHGGDPESIDFFFNVGIDYVSASPYRIPIAKLAAAQASLKKVKQYRSTI
jgi:pyruvate,orthophosphate dikinase